MNTKKYDVVALGELLIDFTSNGVSERGNSLFEANPGGAPCNVLSMLGKLNKKTAFIGKVGDDAFGNLLEAAIKEVGIDTRYLLKDSEIPTTLAFVHNSPDGDRSFSFYRKPGADMMLRADEISEDMVKDTGIFHFGTLSMTDERCGEATLKAVKLAKEAGALISLDPNLREPLWDSLDTAREKMLKAVSLCDILKISDNEIQFLTGLSDYDEGIEAIRRKYNIPLVCLTMGKDGSRAYYKDMRVEVKGYKQEKTVDTTGAGDTFCGCVLGFLCDHDINSLSKTDLTDMLSWANAAASLITTKPGAIRSMPEVSDISKLIRA